jgi:hypothetical protein
MDIQSKVPPALCTLHNFIRRNDPSDIKDYTNTTELSHIRVDDPGIGELALHTLTAVERDHADRKREQIAQEMWNDYQCIIPEQGEVLEDPPEV